MQDKWWRRPKSMDQLSFVGGPFIVVCGAGCCWVSIGPHDRPTPDSPNMYRLIRDDIYGAVQSAHPVHTYRCYAMVHVHTCAQITTKLSCVRCEASKVNPDKWTLKPCSAWQNKFDWTRTSEPSSHCMCESVHWPKIGVPVIRYRQPHSPKQRICIAQFFSLALRRFSDLHSVIQMILSNISFYRCDNNNDNGNDDDKTVEE